MAWKKWNKMGTGFNLVEDQKLKKLLLKEYSCCEPSELRLIAIAKEYHDKCDSFDSATCHMTAPDGEPIVTEPGEQALINKNAKYVLRQLQEKNWDIPKQIIWKAIQRHGHESPSPSLYRESQSSPQRIKCQGLLEELKEPVI